MRNLVLISCMFLFSFVCKDKSNMFKCKGIPDVNQGFCCMYFKTENEGYLFGTYTEYEELSIDELNNPNIIPKSTDEANIYKTIDGGKNWVKINSTRDYSYYNTFFINGNSILIQIIDRKEILKSNLVNFDISTNKIIRLNYNFERMGEIWSNDTNTFVSSKNNGNSYIFSITPNFKKIDSTAINVVFKNNVISFGNDFYALTWENHLYNIVKKQKRKLPIIPENLIKQDENSILIAGNSATNENEISLVSYDVNTHQSKIINKFKDYSIIENLQSNDKAIIGFIGNIKGIFTEYDLIYSLDKGKTWKIKKLVESNYVRPSCLIDNIVYIYSGGARMQKIELI